MISKNQVAAFLIIAFAAISLFSQRASAQEPDCHAAIGRTPDLKPVDAKAVDGKRLLLPDVNLVNEDGRKVRFRSEIIAGKTVAINFIFTTCSTICPPMGANFAALQKLLSDKAGKDVQLISISIDPLTDTPDRLRAWRQRFNGGPGWTLLTGAKQDVDTLLTALDVFTASKTQHSPVVLVGSERDGWQRAFGLASPAKLAELLNGAAAADGR